MPIPTKAKFDYSIPLTFECGGHDVEVLAEGEYTVHLRDPAQFAIETCTADLSDDVWESLEEAIAEQAVDDVAQWFADRDDYLCDQAEDRELERRFAA